MRTLGVLLLIALLSGCAQDTIIDPGPGTLPSGSSAPDDLLIQVRSGGGFVPANYDLTNVPTISVYGDGRVITPAPRPEIFPGKALPDLRVQHVTSTRLRDLVDQALRAGVGTAVDLGRP